MRFILQLLLFFPLFIDAFVFVGEHKSWRSISFVERSSDTRLTTSSRRRWQKPTIGENHMIPAQKSALYAILPRRQHHIAETLSSLSRTTTQPIAKVKPFLVEKLPNNPSNLIFPEIANMCIEAFFNDSDNEFFMTPVWKQIQLNFLRRLQTADLERRRRREQDSNVMLLARECIPATRERTEYSPLILNLDPIVHRERLDTNDVVRGELLGFVEVTLKPYGLGSRDENAPHRSNREIARPVLTNLSVVKSARRSGVGSALMRACEDTVFNVWRYDELILEVEDDNESAIAFYKKRGYEVLFADTTARRYDVNGLFLQQKRCTRLVMRKRFGQHAPVLSVLQRLRDTYQAVLDAR